MCGIFGFVGDLDEALARRCVRTLAHRGPDGEGLWRDTGVTLGHRRLAILDLSDDATQPMADNTRRYHIVFNGEIYNFIELRRQLESLGHHFRSESDTEVLLAAFIQWGEACHDRLNGMWAFGIWDTQTRELFLSRDRFGKKPLFFANFPHGFAFASEMKALLPLLDYPRANVDLVKDAGRIFHYESTEECVVEGIRRVRPGHCAWLRQGRMVSRRWWCTLDHVPEIPNRYEDQVEQFRELFFDACRLRMRSDVPIGTALSGGLDSSATICAMARLARTMPEERMGKSWQHAFVASFPGTPVDEARYAKKVTDFLGIPATFINVDPIQAIPELDRQLYLFEDLYITSPIPFMLTYKAVKSKGISVTLDGHGADELFGGYNFDFLVALNDAGFNLRRAIQIVDTYYSGWPTDESQYARLPNRWFFLADWHARRIARRLLRPEKSRERFDRNHPNWQELDALSRQLYVSTHETILPTLLRNYDRYSMANGVEIRMPFMDHRIVAFAFALPWIAKIRGNYSKAIVREALAHVMPTEIAWRTTKIGFTSPVVDWMKGPLKCYLLDTLSSDAFKQCELIEPTEVDKAVRHVIDHRNAQFADGERAWLLLSPYLWQRAFLNGAGRPGEVNSLA